MSKAQRHIRFRPIVRGLSVRRHAAGAFTLLELLVAIAIIALLAAGVAAIFAAVGDTVSAGKRVSTVNKYSVLMEGVIREDFKRLTRDGFLVIRHELANNGNPVSLYRGDPDPRQRRIDEVMFFTRGDYASVRRPMTPGITARSNEARVYIGIGQRRIEDLTTLALGTYLYPALDDLNVDQDARLGAQAVTAGVENPNRFASDWTLLRHVTLLVPPAAGEARTADDLVFDIDPTSFAGRQRLRDSDVQIGLQPAAQSIFRVRMDDARTLPGGMVAFTPPPASQMVRDSDHSVWPRFSSGLVDVATETLAEIRSVVTSAGLTPFAAQAQQDYFLATGAFNPANIAQRDVARKWMLNAMPGELTDTFGEVVHPETLSRIRYEPTPPLLGIPDSEISNDRERAYREADQEMLSASAFIPRCTEFIVEWSFGWTNNNPGDPRFGQIQWHGLDRVEEDIDGDGSTNQRDRVASLFRLQEVRLGPNGTNRDTSELVRIRQLVLGIPIDETLAYQESVFGYYDPGLIVDTANPAHADDDDVWPWPTLIRITMSFADPTDPTIETTTQFVVEITDER